MDTKDAIAELKTARKAIDKALKALLAHEASQSVQADVETNAIGICGWCKKPILEDDSTNRGVHSHCYNDLYHFVRTGEKTLDEFEASGVLKPRKIGGRPRKTYADVVDKATNSGKPLKKMPKRKKGS